MAIFSKIIAISALAALVSAAPLNIPRDMRTVTETEWTTREVPVTLWVDGNGKPISTEVPGGNFAEQSHKTLESSAYSPSSSSISTTTTPAAVAAPVVPTTSVAAPAAPAQPTTTTIPSADAAPSTPQYTAPAASSPAPALASSSPAAATPTNTVSSGASDSASCEGSGNACEGDITHWDGGLGACGWDVNSASDMQIALPYGFMGTQSNGNPYCGRSLTIKNPTTGTTIQATVGDKCMGCTGRSIDLTNAAFAAVGNGCDGRCSGFEWWFN